MADTCPHGKQPYLTYIQEEPVILQIIFGGNATHFMHRLQLNKGCSSTQTGSDEHEVNQQCQGHGNTCEQPPAWITLTSPHSFAGNRVRTHLALFRMQAMEEVLQPSPRHPGFFFLQTPVWTLRPPLIVPQLCCRAADGVPVAAQQSHDQAVPVSNAHTIAVLQQRDCREEGLIP